MKKKTELCWNCKYYEAQKEEPSCGTCRRYPPTCVLDKTDTWDYRQPTMVECEYCGEWKERGKK